MRDPYKDNPSTYFVQDRSNRDEMTRLHIQDQLFTAGMGGMLSEQADPTIFEHVLDVGCGTGDWLIEAAKTYPTMTRLVGVDISERMIRYAQSQAQAQQVSDRVQFHVMDALRKLDFPNNHFDLINQRMGFSYLRKEHWPNLLWEYQRLCKREGVIRITESGMITQSGSPAQIRLNQLVLQALYQAGNFFTQTSDGLTSQLPHLLRQYAGIRQVQTRAHLLEYRAGTPEWQSFYEDVKLLYQTILPFLQKWTRVPDDYETIYWHMLKELQQPGFVAIWPLLTVWGVKTRE